MIIRKVFGVGLALTVFGAVGCSMETGEADDESLGEVSEAIFQAGCGTMEADKVIEADVTPQWSHNAPSLQRNACLGSRIVDVWRYQEGSDVDVDGATVEWGDFTPSTQRDCESLWLGTSVYLRSGGQWVHHKDTQKRGVWDPPHCQPNDTGCLEFGNRCIVPSTTYVASVSDGRTYRFVGSARQLAVPNGSPSGSHFLRNVNFQARIVPEIPR